MSSRRYIAAYAVKSYTLVTGLCCLILKECQSERYVLSNALHVSELIQRLLHFEYCRSWLAHLISNCCDRGSPRSDPVPYALPNPQNCPDSLRRDALSQGQYNSTHHVNSSLELGIDSMLLSKRSNTPEVYPSQTPAKDRNLRRTKIRRERCVV